MPPETAAAAIKGDIALGKPSKAAAAGSVASTIWVSSWPVLMRLTSPCSRADDAARRYANSRVIGIDAGHGFIRAPCVWRADRRSASTACSAWRSPLWAIA